uniref:Uncharacterized protein n=1 Tax=Mycena chlorophos TaxID=658473 RepID=A0ABQ0L9H3_MYCCL|nr:predicted protein [Mycena chlorophos]
MLNLQQFLIDIPPKLKLKERIVTGSQEQVHRRYFLDPATGKNAQLFISGTLFAVERLEGGEYWYIAAPPSGDLRNRFTDVVDDLKEYMTHFRPAAWKDEVDLVYGDGNTSWKSSWRLEVLQACQVVMSSQEERAQHQAEMRATMPEDGLMSVEVADMLLERQAKVLQEWADSVADETIMDEDSENVNGGGSDPSIEIV